MATTVADDIAVITARENTTGFGINNIGAPNAAITDPRVQGSFAVDHRVNNTGVSGGGFNAGSTDVSVKHVFHWVQSLDDIAARASDGWRIRLSSSTTGATNFDDITVGGGDDANLRRKGYSCFCCNALRDGENVNGTPPAASAVISFSQIGDHLTASSRFTFFMDQQAAMTGITLTAGTAGVPGTSADVAANDVTNGRGQWMTAEGVNFLLGKVIIGDVTAATDSHFTDTLEAWVFRGQPVKNDFHGIETVGGSGTNAVTFGTEVGSGITAVGVAGNLFKSESGVSACFFVTNTDADITAKYFGCQFINSLFEDHSFAAWEDNGTVFTDNRRNFNIAGGSTPLWPVAEVAGDAWYIGDRDRGFFGLEVDLTTLGVGSPVLAYEYWDGSAWVALPTLVDGTSGQTADGRITWAKPADWTATAVNAITAFYMRCRLVSGSFSTNPTAATVRPLFAGLMKWEQANADAISCLFSGCGPISIRNGALVRKCTITDSNAGAVGAVDIGEVDPAADSVRDLQIQNSTAGILVRSLTRFFNAGPAVDKGAGQVGIPDTAHGFVTGQEILIAGTTNYNGVQTVHSSTSVNEIVITDTFVAETFAVTDSAVLNSTFNLRNIQFAGNTKDIRVDFPATSTVTFNILEGGSTPTTENVNTSTIVINNTVTLTVQVNDSAGVAVEGARVRIENASTGALVAQGETNASGTFTDATFNFVSDLGVTTKVRLKGFKSFRAGGTITAAGLTVGVTFQTDTIVDMP